MDRVQRAWVVVAQDAAKALQRLAEEGLSLGVLAHRFEQEAHVVDRAQRAGVVVAQDATAAPQGLAEVRLSLSVLAHQLEQGAHFVDRVQRTWVLVAQFPAPGSQACLLQGHRGIIKTDIEVGCRDRLLHGGARDRLVGELLVDGLHGAGQHVLVYHVQGQVGGVHPGKKTVKRRQGRFHLRRIGAFTFHPFADALVLGGDNALTHRFRVDVAEHGLLELGDCLQLIRALISDAPLLGFAQGKTYRNTRRRQQYKGDHADCRHDSAVSTDELLDAVGGTRRTCYDRLVFQVPADVGCQVGGCRISPSSVFFQCLHRDPVQVAA